MENTKLKSVVQKMEAQSNLIWAREKKLIEDAIGNKTGEELKILEVGSGPGVITEKICNLFPNSLVTCLELDQELLEFHKEHASENTKKQINIVQGNISEIDLGEEQYDIVFARLVLQHVVEVDKAIQNINKLLKKGGKLVVTEVDEGLFGIIDPPFPELEYILNQHIQEQVIEGGDRFIGRKLWRKMKQANFSKVNLELIPVNSDELGIQAFAPQVDYEEMETMIDNKLIDMSDIDKTRAAAERFLKSEYPFALLVLFFVVGEK